MADTVATSNSATGAAIVTSSPATKKAVKTTAVKKPRIKANHPPTSEMVNTAVKSLKERGGSSFQAIKKYLSSNYKIDADKLAPFIKKYLKSAVVSGQLIQTKGKGASGSFKLAPATKSKLTKKAVANESGSTNVKEKPKKSTKAASGEKKIKAKKTAAASPKKKPAATAASKKAASASSEKSKASSGKVSKKVAATTGTKSASAKTPKSPKQKPTKPTKSSIKKPKTPKPKKATPAKKAAATAVAATTGTTAKKAASTKKK